MLEPDEPRGGSPDTLGPEPVKDEPMPIDEGGVGGGVEEDEPLVLVLVELRLVLLGSEPNEPLVGGGGGGRGVTRLPPLMGIAGVVS